MNKHSEYFPVKDDDDPKALPADLVPLMEALAENVHDTWAAGRLADGWTYGPERDDSKKQHPCLVPYNDLPEDEKEYDRRTARATIGFILSKGYRILLLALLLVACSHGQTETASDTVGEQREELFEPWQNPYPDLTKGQMRQLIITSIAGGDKETFASLVRYPIRRDYPLRNIENKEQMIANFDLIFDNAFRDAIAMLDSNSWEEVGWRGWMLCNGELWGDGPVLVINHTSLQEQELRSELIANDIRALHPSLQGGWIPVDRLLISDEEYGLVRIDCDTSETSTPSAPYRMTLFKKNAGIGDPPTMTLTGHADIQGSAGYTTYHFRNDNGYVAVYSPDPYPEEESEGDTFKPYITLRSPEGHESKLTIEQSRYYQ